MSTATLYRHWASKDALVTDAVSSVVAEIRIPDHADVRGDLLSLMRDAVRLYTTSVAARALRGVTTEMANNPALLDTIRERFLDERRAALRAVLERGVARRELVEAIDYVSDPLNMSHWYSAVQAVRTLSEADGRVGATYLVERRLPGGPVRNELEIVSREPPAQFTMRTTSGPTPLTYRYTFSAHAGGTLVELHATVDFDGIAALAGPLAVRAVKRGMDANLAALKAMLEREE